MTNITGTASNNCSYYSTNTITVSAPNISNGCCISSTATASHNNCCGDISYSPSGKYLLKVHENRQIEYIDVTDAIKESMDKMVERQKEIDAEKPEPRPKDPIKQVYINSKKGTTTVLWEDGTMTMVTCADETFDLEKGIAMCFMKKMYDNRGCFNVFLNKWLEDAVDQSVKRQKTKKVEQKDIAPKTKKRRFKKKTSQK